jgi:hypothetical protein
MKKLATCVFVVAAAVCGHTQDKPKWDIDQPLGPVQKVEFDTSEGTWMNLEVSPDGKLIVFDLLGDVYTLPIDGGTATRITQRAGVRHAASLQS